MPHGFCYLWEPRILWLHVISDSLIALSYYCIPLILVYFIRKHRDLPFNRIFWMFGGFILACGTTHLMEIWNVWHGSYVLAGVVKAITAAISVLTAAVLIPLVPKVLSLPGRMHLEEVNRKLEREIAERKRTEPAGPESLVTGLVKRLSVFASAAAVFSVVAGLLGLAGWKLHIATLDNWGAPPVRIVPNAAAGCVLLGVALWLLKKEGSQSFPRARKLAARTAAAIVCLMGSLVLAEHVFGWDFGIDHLLIVVPPAERIPGLRPGLIASSAACDFLLLGSALLLLDWKTRTNNWPAQYLSFGAAIVAIFGLFALLLEPGASGLTMAFPAAVTFFVLASGIVCSRATWAIGGLLTSPNAGARLLRSVIPAALLVLGFIGWSVSKALLREAHFTWVEASLLAILCGALLFSFITWVAFIVDRSDALNAELERRVDERTAALGESEGRLAGVIQSAMDAIVTVDERQNILLFNGAAEKMFRCPAAEAVGQPVARFIPQRFHAAHAGHVRKFGDTGVSTRSMGAMGALWAVRGDGEEFQAEASISRIEAAGKRIFTVILRDVTERKRAEDALNESEQRYRLLFSEMVVGFALLEVIYDENGQPCDHRYLEANPAFETQSGLPRDRALGRTIREVFPGLDPFWIETYGRVATTGESVHFENYVQPLGKWLEVTAFRTRQGQVGVTFADVSERKRAEEMRERLAAVVEFSDDAIIGKNLDGTITSWNSGAEKVFGYSSSEAVGKPMRMLLPPERADEESEILARIGRGESVEHFETVRVRKDGKTIDVSATISPIKDGSGEIVGASKIARDITERKLAEKQLAEQAEELSQQAADLIRSRDQIHSLNEELEHRVIERTAELQAANKELEAFSYSVSHDLRAPLLHISGFSQLLVEEFGPTLDPEARHYLDRIQAGTQKMGLLVDELLNLARVGRHALNRRPANLNEIVAEVVTILQPDSEGRQVEWMIADLPAAECDPVLVKQVFQNLLANALKFTRPRARAVIEVGRKEIGEDGQPVLMVRDNGAGFDMKYAGKLFGVFQRLHRAADFEGAGIGLATVQRIVHKHGGRVWAEGELDKGASFYFTLGVGKQVESKRNGAAAGGQA